MRNLRNLAQNLRGFANDLRGVITTRSNRKTADGTKVVAMKWSSGVVKDIVFNTPFMAVTQIDLVTKKKTDIILGKHGYSWGLAHPYGHGQFGALGMRGPIPYGNAAMINKQTGLFLRSWRIYQATAPGGIPSLVLQNVAPYAQDLEKGTDLMIKRPLGPILKAYVDKMGPINFRTEFGAAWVRRFGAK